jgi:hypothetical protein
MHDNLSAKVQFKTRLHMCWATMSTAWTRWWAPLSWAVEKASNFDPFNFYCQASIIILICASWFIEYYPVLLYRVPVSSTQFLLRHYFMHTYIIKSFLDVGGRKICVTKKKDQWQDLPNVVFCRAADNWRSLQELENATPSVGESIISWYEYNVI